MGHQPNPLAARLKPCPDTKLSPELSSRAKRDASLRAERESRDLLFLGGRPALFLQQPGLSKRGWGAAPSGAWIVRSFWAGHPPRSPVPFLL